MKFSSKVADKVGAVGKKGLQGLKRAGKAGWANFTSELHAVIEMLIKSREVIIALIVIGALFLVGRVVWWIWRNGYPRPMWINWTQDMDRILDGIYLDMNRVRSMVKDGLASAGGTPLGERLALPLTMQLLDDMMFPADESITTKVKRKPIKRKICGEADAKQVRTDELADEQKKIGTYFEVYLEYEQLLNNKLDDYIYTRWLKHWRKYSECGTDYIKGKESVQEAIARVQAVQAELNAADESLNGVSVPFVDDESMKNFNRAFLVDLCVGVRRLHFYICGDGRAQLQAMYESRRFSFTGFLVTLVKPFIDRIIIREIWARWRDCFSKSQIDKNWQEFVAFLDFIMEGDKVKKNKLIAQNEAAGSDPSQPPPPQNLKPLMLSGVWVGLRPQYFMDGFVDMLDYLIIGPVENSSDQPVNNMSNPVP